MKKAVLLFFVIIGLLMTAGGVFAGEVVVYTSVDQVFSEPVLKDFEKATGIRVKPLFDVEASKTVGLVNRLIAEKSRPRADVFWNSEISRTIQLLEKGVLAPYGSAQAQAYPDTFKDPNQYWTGFAARARVLVYNTDMLSEQEAPASIFELTRPRWRKKFTIAYPLFGTTAMHVAALYSVLGEQKAQEYLKQLVANEAVVVDGNAVTRDLVAEGQVPVGFTDTDDASVAIAQGKPIRMVYPDKDGIGTLLIPNTVALVKGGPNPENGKKLIDNLLSDANEKRLVADKFAQVPLRGISELPDIAFMTVDYQDIARNVPAAMKFCQDLFIR